MKALVAKALEKQGLSTEPRIFMKSPGELTLVGSPLKVPCSQGSTAATTPVDRIREPTSCTLVFLSGRQNIVMEVATGVAYSPGGLHHNNKIPPNYTRVEVHTIKPEFMQWRIDHTTPEGLVLLRDVMGQFILWHKWDIILTTSSPHPPLPNLEQVVEVGEIFSPSRDHHIPEMPHSSPSPSEHAPNKPQPSLARTEQVHDEMS